MTRTFRPLLCLLAAVITSSCVNPDPNVTRGRTYGATSGAAIGAIIGNNTEMGSWEGAAAGAALGAILGDVAGRRRSAYYQQSRRSPNPQYFDKWGY